MKNSRKFWLIIVGALLARLIYIFPMLIVIVGAPTFIAWVIFSLSEGAECNFTIDKDKYEKDADVIVPYYLNLYVIIKKFNLWLDNLKL